MSAQYTVNISIDAGSEFSQVYYLTNPDMSPRNITGAKLKANLGKHSRAYHAITSTSEKMDWNVIPFTCYVVDGVSGIFSINLSREYSSRLEEGKYVYGVTLTDISGNVTPNVVSGLAFVTSDIASMPTQETITTAPSGVPISATPPANPKAGDLWHNSYTLFIYYVDPDGDGSWVESNS
jgi:hypothetical protein